MVSFLNIFGKSPFTPIMNHMDEVSTCIYLLETLFKALEEKDYNALEETANKISAQEHKADLTKENIRSHLPKSLFLPIDRGNLLEILTIQDSIADSAEDIAVTVTLKKIEFLDSFKKEFKDFLAKNIDTFNGARRIIKELHELVESSFGGIEAQKVRQMVEDVAFKEHQTDVSQRKLIKRLVNAENEMSYTTFYLWQTAFKSLAAISNLSENLAYRVRMTLELK